MLARGAGLNKGFLVQHPRLPRTPRTRPVAQCRSMTEFYGLAAKDIEGAEVNFDSFKGKVVLITNVASACGYTNSNYKELTALHEKYHSSGLEIMAFPCNQFGKQEKGSNETIKEFVQKKYGVEFKMMDKVEVNGPATHPVYEFLKGSCESCSGEVSWNFAAKFIVDKSCVSHLQTAML